MHYGFGITLFPTSWAIGLWKKPHKTLLSLGPIRLVFYRTQGEWKAQPVHDR